MKLSISVISIMLIFLDQTFKNCKNILAMADQMEIHSLGQIAQIGCLYDAKRNEFTGFSILKNQLSDSLIRETESPHSDLDCEISNNYEEKFNTIKMSTNIQMKILVDDMFKGGASASFIKDTKTSARSVRATIFQEIRTVRQQIVITDENLLEFIDLDKLKNEVTASHIVTQIQWGGNLYLSVEDSNSNNMDKYDAQLKLNTKLKLYITDIESEVSVGSNQTDLTQNNDFKFKLFGDILTDTAPTNFSEALKIIEKSPKLLSQANVNKGIPISYTLLDIYSIRKALNKELESHTFRQIEVSVVRKCVHLFDEMNEREQNINDLSDEVNLFKKLINLDKVRQLDSFKQSFLSYQNKVKTDLKSIYEKVVEIDSDSNMTDIESRITEAYKDLDSENKFDKEILSNLTREIFLFKDFKKHHIILLDNDVLQRFIRENIYNNLLVLFYTLNESPIVEPIVSEFYDMIANRQAYGDNTIFAFFNLNTINDINKEHLKLDVSSKIMQFLNGAPQGSIKFNDKTTIIPETHETAEYSEAQHNIDEYFGRPIHPFGKIINWLG